MKAIKLVVQASPNWTVYFRSMRDAREYLDEMGVAGIASEGFIHHDASGKLVFTSKQDAASTVLG